ncbi:hypothetical protein MAUB1S_03369 [Mycolicibacterium aubagnense]
MSPGLNATSSTTGAVSRSAYVTCTSWTGEVSSQELGLLVAVHPVAEVDVIGAQHDPRVLGVGVGVVAVAADEHGVRAPAADSPRTATATAFGHEAGRAPGSAAWRTAVTLRRVGEGPATFVAVPSRRPPGCHPPGGATPFLAPVVGALRATGGAVFAHAGRRRQSKGRARNRYARPSARRWVLLHGVAGECCTDGPLVAARRVPASMNGSPALIGRTGCSARTAHSVPGRARPARTG